MKQLRDLEKIFLELPAFEPYWRECHRRIGEPAELGVESAPPQLRHVITLQVRFMEEAYTGLRLGRYANAPANRGWMNLFRRWAQSRTFNLHFRSVASTLAKEFVEFYEQYLYNSTGPIELVPIPHPWDPALRHGGVYLDPGMREAQAMTARARGDYRDE